jgi:hypothetical protein
MRPVADEQIVVELSVGWAVKSFQATIILANMEDLALMRWIAIVPVRVSVAVGGGIRSRVNARVVALNVARYRYFSVA